MSKEKALVGISQNIVESSSVDNVGVQVLIREEHGFKAWLDGLGRVDWVVVGSSFHTNYLTSVLKL